MGPFLSRFLKSQIADFADFFSSSSRYLVKRSWQHCFFCRHYYYEKEALVYGFYEENQWKFGLKDRGQNNGYSIKLSKSEGQCVSIDVAKNHLWKIWIFFVKLILWKNDFSRESEINSTEKYSRHLTTLCTKYTLFTKSWWKIRV